MLFRSIYLPRAEGEAANASIRDVGDRKFPLRVLLVEDHEEVRPVAAAQLRTLGCTVIEASTGQEGLDALRRDPDIELLFTDMVMPGGLSGLQLAREALHQRPGLPVVFASGFSEVTVDGATHVRDLGPLLSKPYTRQELANAMAAVRSGARQVQGCMNGLGERTGNTNLTTVIPNLELKMGFQCLPEGNIGRLTAVSHHIAELLNRPMNPQAPYVGASAFAHKAGLHVSAKIGRAHV